MSLSVDDGLKKATLTSVTEIPAVGGFLALIIDLLWSAAEPGEEHIGWDDIRSEAKRIADKEISAEVEGRLSAALRGLGDVLQEYRNAAASLATTNKHSREHLYSNYVSARDAFDLRMPDFQEKGFEGVLLVLFVQAANLHLSLLRDGSLHGREAMGMSEAEVDKERAHLSALVDTYGTYVRATFGQAMSDAGENPSERRSNTALQLTLKTLDYATIWSYWKPGAAPPSGPILTREVFSRTFGQDDHDDEMIEDPPQRGYYPPPPDGGRVTLIHWGWTRHDSPGIDCLSVHYDTGFKTPWMGSEAPVITDRSVDIDPRRPIRSIEFTPVGIFSMVTKVHYLDEPSPAGGGGDTYPVPAGHYISSINVKSKFLDHPRGMLYHDLVRLYWFGFKYDPALETTQGPG